LLRIVVAVLLHRPVRSLTAVIVTAVAMGVLSLTAAGLRRADVLVSRMPDYLLVTCANLWADLPVSYAARLAKVPGVDQVEYYNAFDILDGTAKQLVAGSLLAASDGYFRTASEGMSWVPPELEQAWRSDKQGLISNPLTATKLGWRPGEMVNVSWRTEDAIRVTPFRFLGTYRGAEPDDVLVHYDAVDPLLPPDQRGRTVMLAVMRPAGQREEVDTAVRRVLTEFPDPVKTGPSAQWRVGAVSGELSTTSLLEGVTGVMLAITCAILGAALSMSMRERRSELATLRALGFSRARLLALIMSEAAVLAFAGYAVGVLLPCGWLAATGGGIDLGPSFLSGVRPGVQEMVLALATACALSLGISLWPALSASRQDVVRALQEA
jgi:putative ABC transport system permease protein